VQRLGPSRPAVLIKASLGDLEACTRRWSFVTPPFNQLKRDAHTV